MLEDLLPTQNIEVNAINGVTCTIAIVPSLDLHAWLGETEPHDKWLSKLEERFDDPRDFIRLYDSDGKSYVVFSIGAAKQVVLMSATKKGRAIREFFVEYTRLNRPDREGVPLH